MIGYLRGKIIDVNKGQIILDVSNVGYEVNVSQGFNIGEEIGLFIQTVIRENSISLFGFKTKQEKSLFNKLLIVNGIGPKAAIDILSNIEPEVLINSILSSDVTVISKIKGIGKKTAEKIIFTLKEKFEKDKVAVKATMTDLKSNELVQALVFLGYPEVLANKVATSVYDSEKDISELIKIAIKEIKML